MPTPIDSLVAAGLFEPEGHYLDTPTYGLAPATTRDAMIQAIQRWHAGTATMAEYDEAVASSRELFARIVDVDPSVVAIGANVSSLVGPVAGSLPEGLTVLAPEGEFTSLLFPLLVNRGLRVELVPLSELAGAIDGSVDVVAFSLVQSSTGEIADTASIKEAIGSRNVITLVDATHAAGWLPFIAADFDFVFVAGYKWLLCPRGVAFSIVHSDWEPQPFNAGWYSGEDPWDSIYGRPLRLANSARRFDTSPAWLSWVGAVPSLEVIASLGVDRINAHDVALANQIRVGLELEESDSAIVAVKASRPDRLAQAGVRAAVRASAVRLGCHVYNSSLDVEAAIDALTGDV